MEEQNLSVEMCPKAQIKDCLAPEFIKKITLTDELSTVAEGTADVSKCVDKLRPSLLLSEMEINCNSSAGTSRNAWEGLEINLCGVSRLALLKVELIDFQSNRTN